MSDYSQLTSLSDLNTTRLASLLANIAKTWSRYTV